MEGAADAPLDCAQPASETQGDNNATSAHSKVVMVEINHLDERASYRKFLEDLSPLSTSKKPTQEDKASIRPRVRKELLFLFASPMASHEEVIEGILMQRFFGSSRSSILNCFSRGTGTWSSTQPVDNAMSRFISTPELLEAMLSHLPVRNLISSTRVSKTFRHLIGHSPTLLRNLFLRPRKEPFETLSFAAYGEASQDDHNEQAETHNIVTLCPLLHMGWQSQRTIEDRFWSEEYEVAGIDPCAAHADFFTQMYLTNPPCVEVTVELDYTYTKLGVRRCYFEDKPPNVCYTISASRKIREETGLTFAMLMEVIHMEGSVYINTKECFDDDSSDEGTSEDEGGIIDGEYELWDATRVVENTTLHDEIRAWEKVHPGMMHLDFDTTEVKLHGVIVRTAADFATIEKEAEQRKNFQAVLLELKQRVADRVGKAHETMETAHD